MAWKQEWHLLPKAMGRIRQRKLYKTLRTGSSRYQMHNIIITRPEPFFYRFSLPVTTISPSFGSFQLQAWPPPPPPPPTFACLTPYSSSSLTFKFTLNVRVDTSLSQHPIHILKTIAYFVIIYLFPRLLSVSSTVKTAWEQGLDLDAHLWLPQNLPQLETFKTVWRSPL